MRQASNLFAALMQCLHNWDAALIPQIVDQQVPNDKMLKTFRLIITLAILLPFFVVAGMLALTFYTLEQEPLVRRNAPVDHQTVAAGKDLLKRLIGQVESAHAMGTTLVVTEAELGYLAQMGSHTFQRLDTDISFRTESIHVRVSLRLPPNPAGEYLNLVFAAPESAQGVSIDHLSVGQMELPGRWLLPLLASLADRFLQDRSASVLLASVRGFQIEGNSALFEVLPPPDVRGQLKKAVKDLQAARFPPGEQERVAHYYEVLVGLGAQVPGRSLSDYLTPLMAEAMKRRERTSATTENRALISALTVYFSQGAFEALIGDLVSSRRALVRPPAGITLAGRWDLMAHFVYSAGITLATQRGVGIAAGEFKELLDAGNGGSGFSFADLAADRAGIRFVAVATGDEASARQLQQTMVAFGSERAFFPSVTGLPEGLSDAQFRRQYGSTQSERYREQVALIDQRIDQLPIY